MSRNANIPYHLWQLTAFYSLAADYPSVLRQQLGNRLPEFTVEELSLLKTAIPDFYGMNYYTAKYARHSTKPASEADFTGNVEAVVNNRDGIAIGLSSGVHWLHVCPEQFRKLLSRVHQRYGKPIYITENGCPCPGEDDMSLEEVIMDTFRVNYIRGHLDQIRRSIAEDNCQVKGYFVWSLLDNLGKYILSVPSLTRLNSNLCSQSGLMGSASGSELRMWTTERYNALRNSRLYF